MQTSTGVNFGWPEAAEIAEELSERGRSKDLEVIAGRISTLLNYFVPEYDREHRFYSPLEAIEHGATSCKTRAYMAHLIASQMTDIKSAVNLCAYKGHASTYFTNGRQAAVVDSTIGSFENNSFYEMSRYDPFDPENAKEKHPLLEYLRTTNRDNGFAWITYQDTYDVIPSGEAQYANTYPLDRQIIDLYSVLMIGEAGTEAMVELLSAKQEVADTYGPDLDDLLGDNISFPNALIADPEFR